jgi:hypothetical protein
MSEGPEKPNWEPISHADLHTRIESGEAEMDAPVRAFWERIRIKPVKWSLPPWGDLGGGFWVVAIIGQQVVWFNDIEDGFNCSRYDSFGTISEYWCNQSELQHTSYWLFAEFPARAT